MYKKIPVQRESSVVGRLLGHHTDQGDMVLHTNYRKQNKKTLSITIHFGYFTFYKYTTETLQLYFRLKYQYKLFSPPSLYLPAALGSSSCRGNCILRTVAGSVDTTDNMVVGAALQKRQSLLLDTVQPKRQTKH